MTGKRRGGLNSNPLADLIANPAADEPASDEATAAAEQTPARTRRTARSAPAKTAATGDQADAADQTGPRSLEPASGTTEKLAGYVPVELLEYVRDICYWTPGIGMTEFVREAAIREARRLEELHNGGKPFNRRPGDVQLKRGPRIR